MTSSFLPTKELIRRAVENPVRNALIPQECRLSWFVPVRRESDGKTYLAAFFYPAPVVRNQPPQIGRPRFHLTIDPESGSIVELTDCSFSDFAAAIESGKIVGTLTAEDLPGTTIAELKQKREEMYTAYDQVLPMVFRPVERLNANDREEVSHFKCLFDSMVEPCLIDFYVALNPNFFDWLGATCK